MHKTLRRNGGKNALWFNYTGSKGCSYTGANAPERPKGHSERNGKYHCLFLVLWNHCVHYPGIMIIWWQLVMTSPCLLLLCALFPTVTLYAQTVSHDTVFTLCNIPVYWSLCIIPPTITQNLVITGVIWQYFYFPCAKRSLDLLFLYKDISVFSKQSYVTIQV